MVPVGPEGVKAFSRGFFELAAAQQPKPQTVAMLSADAEFAKTSADGARENAAAYGFKIVYDKSYPPPTTDFAPTMRARAGGQRGYRVCRRLSAGHRRHRARRA